VIPGVRFVEEGNVATSGGLACGIDLAMHVVERYFGKKLAEDVALNLEYQGQGWKDPSSRTRNMPRRLTSDLAV
jgi:transcriptional regulator GlxA family with amidase domain